MKETKKITVSAFAAAISTVLCILSSVFPTMSLTVLAVCGLISALALNLCGYRYALLQYVAVSVLALVLSPDKSCAVYYIFLFGHYPILKAVFERISNSFFRWGAKLLCANLFGLISLWIVSRFLGISDIISDTSKIAFFVLYNIAFVLYDICLGRLIFLFLIKRRGKGGFR